MFLFSGTQPVKQNKISKLLARNGLGWGWKDGLKSAWLNSRSPWAQFPELMWKKNNLGAVAGHCKTRAGELNIGGSLDLPSQPMYQMWQPPRHKERPCPKTQRVPEAWHFKLFYGKHITHLYMKTHKHCYAHMCTRTLTDTLICT